MNWQEHIDRDPAVLGGKPKLRGTRLSVELVLVRLGEGWTRTQLQQAYPQLGDEAIQACLAYAADALAADEVLDVPLSAA